MKNLQKEIWLDMWTKMAKGCATKINGLVNDIIWCEVSDPVVGEIIMGNVMIEGLYP